MRSLGRLTVSCSNGSWLDVTWSCGVVVIVKLLLFMVDIGVSKDMEGFSRYAGDDGLLERVVLSVVRCRYSSRNIRAVDGIVGYSGRT